MTIRLGDNQYGKAETHVVRVTRAASHDELSKHAKTAARARTAAERSTSVKQAARTRAAHKA